MRWLAQCDPTNMPKRAGYAAGDSIYRGHPLTRLGLVVHARCGRLHFSPASGPSGGCPTLCDEQKPGGRRKAMAIPPLVARELLVYSRQPWTYWLRLLSAIGAVSVLAIMA